MIRVAHVISSLKKGGAEEVLCSLVEQLDPDQFMSYVLYFHAGPHVERLRAKGIKLYHIRGFFCMYDPVFLWRLIGALRRLKPDCIHALLWSAQCASRVIGSLLCIPVITVYHNQATLESGMRLFLDRVTLTCATNIVAVSRTVAQSITKTHSFIPASSIITIANGIDRARVEKYLSTNATISKKDLNMPDDAKVIGTVGRLHKVKNHTLLLQSYAIVQQHYPDSYLILVGDGPEQDRLAQSAQRLNLQSGVIFVTQKQAYPYYSLFDCFVLASEQEGMSMALLEAHYFKCASVVTHQTFCHDVITHGHNGLLVPPNNATELAHAIVSVLSNKTLQHTLGNNAHINVVQKYTIETMVQQYEQLFKEVS